VIFCSGKFKTLENSIADIEESLPLSTSITAGSLKLVSYAWAPRVPLFDAK